MTAPVAVRRWPRATSLGGPVFVLAVTFAVGFLLVGQVRTSERFRQPLQAESEEDLTRILASLNAEADALREEISTLKLQLVDLRGSSRREESATRAAEEELRRLEVLSGTVPVTGPGIVMVIDDPGSAVGYDVLLDIVQELRDAGAEAIAVDGHRVGVRSAFTERAGRIALDGTSLRPPYEVMAIGQPATLDGGLKIPGGAIDTLEAIRGVKASVQRQAKVDLPALARTPEFRSARPVGSGS